MTDSTWIETEATVTTCRYQFRALSPRAFGFQTGEKFRITFDYYAHGQLYSDEFQSPIAIAQNECIAVSYNPLHPEQNSLSRNEPASEQKPPSLIVIGITGSIILSLIWLAILHGCH